MFRRGLINGAIISGLLVAVAAAMLPFPYAPWQDLVVFVTVVIAWGISAREYHREVGPLMSLLDPAWARRLVKFSVGAGVTWAPLMFLLNWWRLGLNHMYPIQVAVMFIVFLPFGAMSVAVFMLVGATFLGRKGAVWG